MEREEILRYLVGLAEKAGIRVEVTRPAPTDEIFRSRLSGLCQVNGKPWIVLVKEDSIEGHLVAVASALRRYAPDVIEERFLPPAVRGILEIIDPGG